MYWRDASHNTQDNCIGGMHLTIHYIRLMYWKDASLNTLDEVCAKTTALSFQGTGILTVALGLPYFINLHDLSFFVIIQLIGGVFQVTH